jgi:alkylhydroperoxidase family enzyme
MASESLDPPQYPPKVARTIEALLTHPASSPPSLRQAVLTRATQLAERSPATGAVPEDLAPYLDRVVFHPERMTDEDVTRLQEHGYPEEQIFELTLCAALGAALARLNRGLAALEGAG